MNNYAKLIDGRLKYAPNSIRTAEGLVCNPRPDKLIPLGYKEVVCDEHPEPSDPPKHYRKTYTEEADRIRVGWEEYTSVPEPQPDPEQLREAAYRAEADQYLMAYEGYLAEGKILEADEQKALYLAKKAEIRERFPDK